MAGQKSEELFNNEAYPLPAPNGTPVNGNVEHEPFELKPTPIIRIKQEYMKLEEVRSGVKYRYTARNCATGRVGVSSGCSAKIARNALPEATRSAVLAYAFLRRRHGRLAHP